MFDSSLKAEAKFNVMNNKQDCFKIINKIELVSYYYAIYLNICTSGDCYCPY